MVLRLGLGVAFKDILNVKDFGAVGDGVADDTAAIQACFDSAFGPAGSPHGVNSTLNKPVFFPNGHYSISSPLLLTQVRGGRIYGAGAQTVNISGPCAVLKTNGCESFSFENLSFSASGAGNCGIELDWDGTGSIGLSKNLFINVNGSGGDYGCRIGFSGFGGSNNSFYSCEFAVTPGGGVAGFATFADSAVGNSVWGGACSSCPIGFWIKKGQIASINDVGVSHNDTTGDVLLESATTLLLKGIRSESTTFVAITNTGAVVSMDACTAADRVSEFCHAAGTVGGAQAKVIMDVCQAKASGTASTRLCSTDSTAQGKFYSRACSFLDNQSLATVLNMGTVTTAVDGTITFNAHGFVDGSNVVFSGSVPAQLTAGTTYYVVGSTVTTNTFKVSATLAGAAITTMAVATCLCANLFLKGFAGSLAQRI